MDVDIDDIDDDVDDIDVFIFILFGFYRNVYWDWE